MEQKPIAPIVNEDSSGAMVVADPATATLPSKSNKKKRGPMNLFRVALYMLRRSSKGKDRKPLEIEASETKGSWTKLVGSMRPLHIPDNNNNGTPTPEIEHFEDVYPSSSPTCSDGGISSRYVSAQNLQELEQSEENGDVIARGDDEYIDTKADEYIAQFYKQMGLQRLDSICRYKKMITKNKA